MITILEPCRCGGRAWLRDDRPGDCWVECDECQVATTRGAVEQVIAAWNQAMRRERPVDPSYMKVLIWTGVALALAFFFVYWAAWTAHGAPIACVQEISR